MLAPAPDLLSYAVAARGLQGTAASGDLALVRPHAGGMLAAAVDGLGHGVEAAAAAGAALAALEAAPDGPALKLVERCHAALRETRGATMTLAVLDARVQTMSWVAVGNVEGVLLRLRQDGTRQTFYVLPRGGILGHSLPALRETIVPLLPGDLVVLATDGVEPGFESSIDHAAAPQQIADRILHRHARHTDDALVLVGRWHGDGGAPP